MTFDYCEWEFVLALAKSLAMTDEKQLLNFGQTFRNETNYYGNLHCASDNSMNKLLFDEPLALILQLI